MIIDKIICLTTPSRRENAQKIEKILKNQNFDVIFQEGINGLDLNPTVKKEYPDLISPYMPWKENRKARLAICLSHLLIWKSIINEKKINLIIEDDVLIECDLRAEIKNMVSKLPFDWDLFYLGHSGVLNGYSMGEFTIAKNESSKSFNYGMQAYIINPSSVSKLIKKITPLFSMQNIDWLLREKYSIDKGAIKAIYTNKPIITHDLTIKSERKSIDKKK
jgi:GR25 family glycosyltransferase involved in LPS biosynthesis